jgi:branched-chain amino acid transport system substrate-binding protein
MQLRVCVAVTAGLCLGVGALLAGAMPAHADETVRIAYIDPLSGPLAETGQLGEQHFRFAIDRANAAQAAGPGRKLELVPLDNEVSPEKSLTLFRKAVDDGIRYITQGNGSSVAFALVDATVKNNKRNPAQSVMFLNYAAVDPALTNDKCSWWHFRFDADVDMKMKALTDYLVGEKAVHKVYVFNPDYSFGVSVQKAAEAMLANRRPDLQVVGAERVPLGKVKDFTPYIAKMQAAGADAVVTGNWGADLELLVKAAADSGFKGVFFTYYLGDQVIVNAAGPGAKGDAQISEWANNVPGGDDITDAFADRFKRGFYYWRVVTEIDMLAAAMKQANSSDPAVVGKVLEGMDHVTALGHSTMRADNHQLLQPMFVSALEPGLPHVFPDVGLGFKTISRIEPEATRMATTCVFKDKP